MERLLRYPEAAEVLGVAVGTLRNMVYADRIKHVYSGGRPAFRERDLEEFVARSTREGRRKKGRSRKQDAA